METPPKPARKPGRPYHSQLAPYAAQIARWRREGKSYQEIADVLAERGVKVHRDTINSFVLVRARGGGKVAVLPEQTEPVAPIIAATISPPVGVVQTAAAPAPRHAVKLDHEPKRKAYAPANPNDL